MGVFPCSLLRGWGSAAVLQTQNCAEQLDAGEFFHFYQTIETWMESLGCFRMNQLHVFYIFIRRWSFNDDFV